MHRPHACLIASLLLSATPARADPALWVAHGEQSTVYLLGDLDSLPPGVEWRSPAIRRALQEADECWFGLALNDDSAPLNALVLQLGFDHEHTLSSSLTQRYAAKLQALAHKLDLVPAQYEQMRPWLAAIQLTRLFDQKSGHELELAPSSVLRREAKAVGKAVFGLNTMEQDVHIYADLSPAFGIELLQWLLDDNGNSAASTAATTAAWQAGEVDTLEDVFATTIRDPHPALTRALITDHHAAWPAIIEAMLGSNKTMLVTVNIGDLLGPDGILETLRHDGVNITRVEADTR